MFFKRISDVYDEEFEEAMAFSGGDIEYFEAERCTLRNNRRLSLE